MIINYAALNFTGFGKGGDEQPPVNKPDGTPYDLDDPQFPVIKNSVHKWKLNYWKLPPMPSYWLKYVAEHWTYFNQTRFHGALQQASFGLLKDVDAMKMKLRGHCQYYYGRKPTSIRLSPNLFNAPHEGFVNRVLIHEMCHQYAFEVHKAVNEVAQGHGPMWQQTMHMAGLTPSRYDTVGNEMYMDKKEKKKHAEQLDIMSKNTQLRSELVKNYQPALMLVGEEVVFIYKGQLVHGRLLGTKTKGKYDVVTKTQGIFQCPKSSLFQAKGD